MEMTKTQKIITSIVAIAVLLAIYIYYFQKKSGSNPYNYQNQNALENTSTSTSATTSGSETKIGATGAYKIEQLPLPTKETKTIPKPIPDLNRPANPPGSIPVSSDALTRATEKILEMQTRLKKNPADLAAWVDLGIYQKMAGDYDGVLISWIYASKLAPTNYIVFANLGDFYGYFMKDASKSESYYKQAISKGPKQAYLYTQLADVYRFIFKDMTKARAIVEKGLQEIPNDPSLLNFKSALN